MLRDTWTKKLGRIIDDIEAGKTPVPVTELYVFGSYARGEPDPNDLNLVVVHEEPSPEQLDVFQDKENRTARSFLDFLGGGIKRFEAQLRKTLRRPGERIDILSGSSLKQASALRTFPQEELHLIWSQIDRDWQSKIDSIRLDPQIATASRNNSDSPKLTQAHSEDVMYVTKLLVQQRLILTRIPIEALSGVEYQPSPDSLPVDDLLLDWEIKAKANYPYACAWLASQRVKKINITSLCEVFDDRHHYRVELGQLNFLKMVKLFERADLHKQCLIPFFKQGYSRDLLVFERGPRW